eukprot:SAG31_NODE_1904_length_6952_cov_15.030498_2_plen_370_part_00
MEKWGNGSLGGQVKLLMICVEVGKGGRQTAESFGKQFKLPATIVNGYIDKESEVPRFGQLGCGGFIVLSADGEFVPRRTSPSYLKKGEGGFREVERILGTLGVEVLGARPDGEAPPSKRQKGSDEKLHLAPVGNVQMDAEHAELVAAGADLAKQRSVASLRRLRDIWAEHSAHEEALFEQRSFGGTRSGGLSSTASHREHHRAILQSFDELLRSCGPSGLVTEESVREMLAELQRHGDVYDSGYADKLEDSAVESLVKGTGEHGTKWMWSNEQGEFEVAFNKDGSFYSRDYPRQTSRWWCEHDFKSSRDHIVIDWADLGVFEMKVDLSTRFMSGAFTTSHPNDSTRSWKAKYIGDLDEARKYEVAACSS